MKCLILFAVLLMVSAVWAGGYASHRSVPVYSHSLPYYGQGYYGGHGHYGYGHGNGLYGHGLGHGYSSIAYAKPLVYATYGHGGYGHGGYGHGGYGHGYGHGYGLGYGYGKYYH